MLADGLEDGDDVEVFFLAFDGGAAGKDGAAIHEHGRAIHAGHGHEAAGHVFVTTADGDEAVHAFAADDGLNRVGDDFAGDEGVFHTLGAHGDAVGNGDGVKNDAFAAGGVDAFGSLDGELVDVDVARGDLAPSGGDADLGFGEVGFFKSDGVKHGAARGTVWAVNNLAGEWAGGVFHRREHPADEGWASRGVEEEFWDFGISENENREHLGAVEVLMQAALGAAMGEILMGKRLGNLALAWGAFFGILPGFEGFLAGLLDTARELAAERGASHSLVVMGLGSWGIAQGLVRIWAREKITKSQAGGFVFGVWAAHVLVDCFSVKGAALFWPIFQKRVAFGFLDSGDWFFTIPLVLAVVWLVIYKEPLAKKTRGKSISVPSIRRRRFYWGVGASLIYALAGLGLKFYVAAGFKADLTRRGTQYMRQIESPVSSNIFLWRAVVERGDQFWVGYRSVFEMPSAPVRWTVYPKGDSALAGVSALRETKTLSGVTDGWWLVRPHAKGAWVGDLRLPEFRTWGSKKGMVDSRLANSWVIDPKSQGDRLRGSYIEKGDAGDYLKRMLARTVGKRESWEANPRLAGVPSLPESLSVEE